MVVVLINMKITELNQRKIDTIQAAILLEKLSIFDEELKLRNKVAEYYSKNIVSNFKIHLSKKIIYLHGHNTHYWLIRI